MPVLFGQTNLVARNTCSVGKWKIYKHLHCPAYDFQCFATVDYVFKTVVPKSEISIE